MYSASSSRFLSDRLSHLTRTAAPLLHHRLDFSCRGEISCVSLLQGGFNFSDLPFVQFDESADRFCGDVGVGAVHRLGEFFEAGFGFAIDSDRHYFGHACIVKCTSAYRKSRQGIAPKVLHPNPLPRWRRELGSPCFCYRSWLNCRLISSPETENRGD